MTRLEKIEREIAGLTDSEFNALADWVARKHAAMFDAQIERDVLSGRLDELARKALDDHRSGRTKAFGD